ncbi:hypothetical protein [Streptomyces sp. FH025]|uniref:hypothetical protein n=1 Tax=Streptomyces sp. FH025 TaxID=2815937 RepID=UPI001A9F91C8|nr:hypothetical protein [Streptomyces sp. FH025]MBO1414429.1 hypothetical protein [Streptomyces sp. FH025]
MRLDITISTSGRIMASTSSRVSAPQLPRPTVLVDAAQREAAASRPGSRADTAFLLAKEFDGQWRPCWAVNLIKAGEVKPTGAVAFVDAVTGKVITQQG